MFKAIVLDLFDTLVDWDPDGLPLMHWKGRDIHTTVPWILPKVEARAGISAWLINRDTVGRATRAMRARSCLDSPSSSRDSSIVRAKRRAASGS